MELEEEDMSDGSDIEVEEYLNYLLEEGNLEEVRDQRVFDELDDIARNMFASDTDSDGEEFQGFQNEWVGDNGDFVPRVTHAYCHNRGVNVCHKIQRQLTFSCVFGRTQCGSG